MLKPKNISDILLPLFLCFAIKEVKYGYTKPPPVNNRLLSDNGVESDVRFARGEVHFIHNKAGNSIPNVVKVRTGSIIDQSRPSANQGSSSYTANIRGIAVPSSNYRTRPVSLPEQPLASRYHPSAYSVHLTGSQARFAASIPPVEYAIDTNFNEHCKHIYGVDSEEHYTVFGGETSNVGSSSPVSCSFAIVGPEGCQLNATLYSLECNRWPNSCSLKLSDYDPIGNNSYYHLVDVSKESPAMCPRSFLSLQNAISIETKHCQRNPSFNFVITVTVVGNRANIVRFAYFQYLPWLVTFSSLAIISSCFS